MAFGKSLSEVEKYRQMQNGNDVHRSYFCFFLASLMTSSSVPSS